MIDVEFLPERIQRQRARFRILIRQGYLLAACVLAMGGLTYVNALRVGRARGELSELHQRAADLTHQIDMIPPLEKQMAELLIKQRIESELGSRTDCTAVLAELCRIMPPNMALVALSLRTVDQADRSPGVGRSPYRSTRAGPAAARGGGGKRKIRRVRLEITGLAPTDVDVANFIGQLSASCVFENVNMGYAKAVAFHGRSAREFRASCYLAR